MGGQEAQPGPARARTESGAVGAGRGRWGLRFGAGEIGGAFGDLGTFLPHVVSALTVGGLPPAGVLFGFGAFYVATGLFYGLPIPVQPMKAVSAVIVTAQLPPGAVAAAGMIVGGVLLLLAFSGAIERLARGIPASVVAGLQLGLGGAMALLGLAMIAESPWLGLGILGLVALLAPVRRCPATLVALAVAVAAGHALGLTALPRDLALGWTLPPLVLPGLADAGAALREAVVPQIALTVTNAVIVTAALARAYFPAAAGRASERRLAVSTGAANVLLAPLGALPMCHGAGGLAAHHRFGARSGAAPVLLGVVLLAAGLLLSAGAAGLLAMIPPAAVGAFLVVAGIDLAASRRLVDARPACLPVIAATALATVAVDAAAGLLVGLAVELLRRPLRALLRRRNGRA